jgi:dienelactone hydrolase
MSRHVVAIAAAVVSLLTTSCGSGSTSSGSAPRSNSVPEPPAPSGDFYTPTSPLPQAPPGTLIWAEKVDKPALDPPGTIWRILYHSRSRADADIAVSGFAIVPAAPATTPRPVYAWAHGSMGQGDQCAPSRAIADNLPPYGGEEAAAGAVIVATDYQGLGTPGEPTYLDGVAEGHAVLDSIRAAAQLPGVGRRGPAVVAGQSQGGGAALWAAQLAHTYAAELDVRGAVALAPAAELPAILAAVADPPFDAYLGNVVLASDGLHASYGNAFDPSTYLTPAAEADLAANGSECADATISHWRGHPLTDVLARDPMTIPEVAAVLNANSPGKVNPGVPILLAQGEQDQQIPLSVTDQLHDGYCGVGATVSRHVYPGADHDGVVDAAATDVQTWIGDRYANRPSAADC